MPKLVRRVKLVAELWPGVAAETEVARIAREEQAGLAELGVWLAEAKQPTAAFQAQIVAAQVAVVGERRRSCVACWPARASMGRGFAPCSATCRSGSAGCSSALVRAQLTQSITVRRSERDQVGQPAFG